MLKPYKVICESYYNDTLNSVDTVTILAENPVRSERRNGPWKVVTTYQETTITMAELMNQDAELVIQYLKERGITT